MCVSVMGRMAVRVSVVKRFSGGTIILEGR